MKSVRIAVPTGFETHCGGNFRSRTYTRKCGVWHSDQTDTRVATQEIADALDALWGTGQFNIADDRVYITITLGETSWEYRMTPWGTNVWVKERTTHPGQICCIEEAPNDMQKALSCIARERGLIV